MYRNFNVQLSLARILVAEEIVCGINKNNRSKRSRELNLSKSFTPKKYVQITISFDEIVAELNITQSEVSLIDNLYTDFFLNGDSTFFQ